MSIGQELLNVPFPEMVYKLASAIARSQANLDRESIEILKIMGDKEIAPVFLPAVKIENGKLVEDEIVKIHGLFPDPCANWLHKAWWKFW